MSLDVRFRKSITIPELEEFGKVIKVEDNWYLDNGNVALFLKLNDYNEIYGFTLYGSDEERGKLAETIYDKFNGITEHEDEYWEIQCEKLNKIINIWTDCQKCKYVKECYSESLTQGAELINNLDISDDLLNMTF